MRDEKGVTLIELLAALTILAIISSIIYGVFFNVNKNYYQISGKSALQQEANTIISTIKSYHQRQNSYQIKYDSSSKKAFIGVGGNTPTTPLGSPNFNIELVTDIPPSNNIININTSKSLNITITLTNKQGTSYKTNTIIKRY